MVAVMQQVAELSPLEAPDWLAPVHHKGRAVLGSTLWPSRKTESWKYTNLRLLETGDFFRSGGAPVSNPSQWRDRYQITDLDAYTLVFINGHWQESLSSASLPEGACLVPFAQASEHQIALIEQHFDSAVETERHVFAALNNQLLHDGVFLHLSKNQRLPKPVHVVWLSTDQDQPYQVAQRMLVVLESGAEAQVIEHFCSDAGERQSFTHGVTELCVGDNARLQHYRLHLEQEQTLHIGGVHANLQRDAQLDSFHLAMGSVLKRIDVVVNYLAEGGQCRLNGIYLPQGHQHVDYHTCVEHRVPHCTTEENFRGIISDHARAVFNGRIHIHPQAQKTLAQLSNKNLLTSNTAEVDTKPELEIYADDVQCAHGATVAQLDETSMHYCLTRGISRQEAEVMLSFGFVNELVNAVNLPALAHYLRDRLAGHFARDTQWVRQVL